MRSETILRALSHAETEYLEQAAAPQALKQRHARRVTKLGLIAAAAAVVLLVGGVTAAVLYAPQIILTKKSEDVIELAIPNNDVAADAPGYLAQCYLPSALPEGSELLCGTLSWGLHADWSVPTPNGDGQIAFSQVALHKDLTENRFRAWMGIDADDLTQDTCEIDGRPYLMLSHSSAYGDAVTYFWKDPASHYLMDATFNEVIPQNDREAFLRSIAPVSQQKVLECFGVTEQTAWRLGELPEGWRLTSYGLDTDETGLHTYCTASDGIAHDVYLEQRSYPNEEEFAAYEKEEAEIDGIPVTRYIALTEVEGHPWRQEVWCFAAPDGSAFLQLTFFSTDGAEFAQSDRLLVFRGLRQLTAKELDLSALNRPD